MQVTKIYQTGEKPINEDAYVINEGNNIYAVIDGATGLKGIPGYIASNTIAEVLGEQAQSKSLLKRIEYGNSVLAINSITYYKEHFGDIHHFHEIPPNQRSTTGIAAIQINESGEYLEYVHAGDCMLFFQLDNGEIRTVTYDIVQFLDQLAIKEIIRLRTLPEYQDVGIKTLREKIDPILLNNRTMLNSKDGYSILDGSAKALEQLEYGRIALKRVQKILMLTDGLTMPVPSLEEDSWLLAAQTAFHSGLEELLHEVERREKEDPECRLYPRLKMSDDKTGILIEL